MKITSGRLGEIEIDPADVITFPDGIIGFYDFKQYVLLDFLENSPLKLLQAVEGPDLAFIVIDPDLFLVEYTLDASKEELLKLHVDNAKALSILAIVTIPEDPYGMTANLQGPILLNKEARLAMQVLNDPGKYSTRYQILSGEAQKETTS